MSAPAYPVNLNLSGRPVLVVGGGVVATRKASELLHCEARVHVVAPEVSAEIRESQATWDLRPYRRGEAASYRLVVTATADPELNRAVATDAEDAGVWVNSADDPANCTFTLPARLRRGDLLVTFSTGGTSPAMATWLRRRFEKELGPEYQTLLEMLSEQRAAIRSTGRNTEGLDWQSALDSGMLDLVREGRLTEAKERLQACLSSSSD